MISLHFMLCMPIVCVLSTLIYITFLLHMFTQHMDTLIYITFLLHMFTQHMDTLIYMNISVAYVYSAYGHIDLHENFCCICLLSIWTH
ncbi:hypothetical protein HanHA300_Chr01g0006461 [Helianthus annuus]|nr:hypothetical protein HanHA300_Chr01g0006461 [Helianthus annuus]KAJ0625927.1 hypothetical protein HanHA89_Chr01g0007131 [Helianthus annuus]KAJ0782281.1 hypothetical protein HanLR1_Chr01g0006281 [Helianthus annuus]